MKDIQVVTFSPLTSPVVFDWNVWIGLPFKSRGRGPEFYDCWGLTRSVIHAGLGVELPSLLDYQDTRIDGDIVQVIEASKGLPNWVEIPVSHAQPFDALVFRINGHANHVGPVMRKGKFLNITETTGSLPARYTDVKFRNRIEGCFRAVR